MRDNEKLQVKRSRELVTVKSDTLQQIQGGRCAVADDGYIIPDCMLSQAQLAYRNAVRANTNGHHQ